MTAPLRPKTPGPKPPPIGAVVGSPMVPPAAGMTGVSFAGTPTHAKQTTNAPSPGIPATVTTTTPAPAAITTPVARGSSGVGLLADAASAVSGAMGGLFGGTATTPAPSSPATHSSATTGAPTVQAPAS